MDPRAAAEGLAAELPRVFGERLRSVLLYGSAARGEYIEGVSNVNVLVLLDDIDPAALARTAGAARQWTRDGMAPLLLEWEEWKRAADVFAIELADMQEAHTLLHGRDPLEGLAVETADLRLQTEREIRSRLLLLRTGLLRAARAPREIGDLLRAALPSLLTYLRAALRLAGEPVPPDAPQVIATGAQLVGAEPRALMAAYEARRRGGTWKLDIGDPVVERFNAAIESIAVYVDSLTR